MVKDKKDKASKKPKTKSCKTNDKCGLDKLHDDIEDKTNNKQPLDDAEVEKTKTKEEALLEFINYLLKKMDMEEIDKLEDFKDIKRDELLNFKLEENEVEICKILFPPFTKDETQYYRRGNRTRYIFTLIRLTCNKIGKKLKYKCIKKTKDNHINSWYEYYIE